MQAWAESLGGITFPLLSDFWPHGAIAEQYDVFRRDGRSERAIYIIDKEGIIQYAHVHDIDQRPENEVLFEQLRAIVPPGDRLKGRQPGPSEEEKEDENQGDSPADGELVLYCNNWCPGCRRARIWLDKHQIAYREINVNRDKEAAKQVRQWSGGDLITPTFDINGTIIHDWDEKKMASLLL